MSGFVLPNTEYMAYYHQTYGLIRDFTVENAWKY